MRALKLIEFFHDRPFLLPAQKEIAVLTEIRVGPLPFNLHELIELLVKRHAIPCNVKVHLGPKLLPYPPRAQSCGGMFIRGIPLQNKDPAIKPIIQEVVGDA